jgi:branched-chain amino acid aminotransferase
VSHAAPAAGAPIRWRLITSSFRIPAGDPLSSFKTTSKLIHVMARMEAVEKGADEALLVNTNGEVAETVGGNLFWICDGTICTVPISCGALPGITRAVVMEICQTLSLPVSQRVIKPGALRKFEGIFITQSVLGIVPVAMCDGEPVVRSPLAEKISLAYGELLASHKSTDGG